MLLPWRYRPLTLIGLSVGLAVAAIAWWRGESGLPVAMFGWCAGVLTHMALLLRHMWGADADAMRLHAAALDEGRTAALLLSLAAAAASLVTVVLDIGDTRPGYTALGVATIALSWGYVHLLFAQDYAREYWLSDGGIDFPGDGATPPFSDFLYFAFAVGTTNGVTDCATRSPAIRRVAMLHGLIAFVFNAVIVGVTVNIASGLLHGGN